MSTVLIILGLFVAIAAVMVLAIRWDVIKLRSRLASAPAWSPGVTGTVRAAGSARGAPVRSLLTGDDVLFQQIVVKQSDVNGDDQLVEKVSLGEPFRLETASGELGVEAPELRVFPSHAFQDGWPIVVGEGSNKAITPEVAAWVASRGHTIEQRDLRVIVRTIRPGDQVTAIGAVEGTTIRGALVAGPNAAGGSWDVWTAAFLGALAIGTMLAGVWLAI